MIKGALAIVAGTAVSLLICAPLAVADRGAIHDPKGGDGASAGKATGPIRHVVIIYQENHSFDNVFGRLCAKTGRCDGATRGRLADGSTIRLRNSPDVVPAVSHTTRAQRVAIDGGRMDGFSSIRRCTEAHNYRCYTQFRRKQIPNLWRLSRTYAMSDRTFQLDSVPSWGAHLELVSTTLDGFIGDPSDRTQDRQRANGWGCDSHLDALWRAAPGAPITYQPSCIPFYGLDSHRFPFGGAYRATQVQPVPTIMDRLAAADRSWKLYTARPWHGYLWAICPSYAKCLYTHRRRNQVGTFEVLKDARSGSLPNFSVVLPNVEISQHNRDSMKAGDNWIGRVVNAIQHGPDWRSTAIFITYDDCGCFYDHVPPPPGLGIRTPMTIVSPWARRGFVDSNEASIASMLAFTEHAFGLAPLSERDAAAYDYSDAFDFDQDPLPRVPMTRSELSPRAQRAVRNPPPPRGT